MSISFAESDLLPISALQHLIFCPRQCALIHNERLWAENRLTVEGQQLHRNAHDPRKQDTRPTPGPGNSSIRIARGLPLRCFRLGLVGQADVVEFHNTRHSKPIIPDADTDAKAKAEAEAHPNLASAVDPASILPVEYKRGRPKKHDADRVQLCAQALCLEEMLSLPGPIPAGRLFYGQTRRRLDVPLDPDLRLRTTQAITQLRSLIDSRQTPPARYESAKCVRCSLRRLCLPELLRPRRTARSVFERSLETALEDVA